MTALALQRQIHVACRDLGLDNDARHDVQIAACGKASMKDMTDADLKLVIKHLKARGWSGGVKQGVKGRKHKAAPRADLRLIHVLWRKLGDVGALERKDRAGLNAFIRAQFGETWSAVPADVDMLRDTAQIKAVVEALKAWGKRAKIDFDWSRIR